MKAAFGCLVLVALLNLAHATEPTFGPASKLAGDLAPQFDGTYQIHLSENPKIRSSARPEPGYFDTLVIELFKNAGISADLVPQEPWKRQFEQSLKQPGHVIYPTTRTVDREDDFKWVGPISRTIWNLYGFSKANWQDVGFDQLLKDATIGVLLGSAREAYLRQRGAQKLVMVPREELLLPMLMANRVDLIAIGGNVLRHYTDVVENLPKIDGKLAYRSCYLYVAISGNVPDSDIETLQNQLDRFKRNGFFIENRRNNGLSTNVSKPFLRAMLDLDNNGVGCVDLNGNNSNADD